MLRLFRLLKIAPILAVGVALFVFLPRPALADDGCGLLGVVFGCDYDQRAEKEANQHNEAMAQIAAQATATALDAQHRQQQLDYQRWLASEQAQQELERIASRERIDGAKIQAELEAMYARERMNALNATTSFNVAALQSDAMIAVANSRAEEARTEAIAAALIALAVVAVAGAIVYAARQHRRAAETQAQPRLLPPDGASDWQRRAVALLEDRGVPWMLRDQRLIAQIDGEWVRVEE